MLDAAFRIDSNAVLNDGIVAQTSDSGVVTDIKRALAMLKAEAYDEATGSFNYTRVRTSETYRALRECTARLNDFDLTSLITREEQLVFWINLYNALILDAVISFDVRDSVTRDLGFFRRAAYRISGMRVSPIFRWYATDWDGRDGTIEMIAREFNEKDIQVWLRIYSNQVQIDYARYDWRLNG